MAYPGTHACKVQGKLRAWGFISSGSSWRCESCNACVRACGGGRAARVCYKAAAAEQHSSSSRRSARMMIADSVKSDRQLCVTAMQPSDAAIHVVAIKSIQQAGFAWVGKWRYDAVQTPGRRSARKQIIDTHERYLFACHTTVVQNASSRRLIHW